jgi:hypothetical protein
MNSSAKIMMGLLSMFAAVPSMGSDNRWSGVLSAGDKQSLLDKQKKHYKLLLERKGVKEFHSADLGLSVMARDWKNAQRKFNNIRKALKDEKLL